ncbi:MAG: hypothetical protein QOJ66_2834 [Ilumatobacteraceae bacterium]|jgi:hypothetical protein
MAPSYGEALTSESPSVGRSRRVRCRVQTHGMRIVEANDWKDAAITLLEPRSPYRPWRTGAEPLRAEERVLAVLHTDPVSVLTVIGAADVNGNATFGRYTSLNLVEATALALIAEIPRPRDPRLNWTLDDSTAEDIELALEDLWFHRDPFLRFGHTSLAAARILLQSRAVCAGCDKNIGLRGLAARDRIHIHTVDPPPRGNEPADWPAAVCTRCCNEMGDNFLDFRFGRHPQCPMCHARRAMSAIYGLPAAPHVEPWQDLRGCCVTEEKWTCSKCQHTW